MITIEEPADNRSLLTLDEIKAAVDETGTANDDALEALAIQVSDIISDLCGIAHDGVNPPTLLSEEVLETVRLAVPQASFPLSRRFVSEVTEVVVAGETLDEVDYEIDAASGVLRYLDASDNIVCWPAGKTVVTYTAGFATVPEPLKAAAKDLARRLWNAEGGNPMLRSEAHEGYGTFTYFRSDAAELSISASLTDTLAPYRTVNV